MLSALAAVSMFGTESALDFMFANWFKEERDSK